MKTNIKHILSTEFLLFVKIKIRNTALSKLGFIKHSCSCSEFKNYHALNNINFSIVWSQLEYAILIWSPVNTQTLEWFKIHFSDLFFTNIMYKDKPPYYSYDGIIGFFKNFYITKL